MISTCHFMTRRSLFNVFAKALFLRSDWSLDGWHAVHDNGTRDTGLGVHVFDLLTDILPSGAMVLFTFYWLNRTNGKEKISLSWWSDDLESP